MYVKVFLVRITNLLSFDEVCDWRLSNCAADGAVAKCRLSDASQQEEQLVGCDR